MSLTNPGSINSAFSLLGVSVDACNRWHIANNDIFNMSDDAIEPDYGYANIRIWGNRMHCNAGVTFQPMYCGPWYLVRNHAITTGNVFKLRVQDRFVCVNSTLAAWTAPVPHANGLITSFCRNNVWMHLGGSEFLWEANASKDEKNRAYFTKYVLFDSPVANWKTNVDYDGFEFSAAKPHPKLKTLNPWTWCNQRFFDLPSLIQLSAQSKAKDTGVGMSNLAEEFDGAAPDLGAFEIGTRIPHYGPRDDPGMIPLDWVLKHQR